MRKYWAMVLAFALLLSGCGAGDAEVPAETTLAPVVDTSAETESNVWPETTEVTLATEPSAEVPAEPITEGVTVRIGEADHTHSLMDGKHLTKKEIARGRALTVESEQPFSAVYVQWDKLPGVYSIQWEGGALECGKENFLHDYIRLPEAVKRITFVFTEDFIGPVCDIGVYTEGAAPDGVQDWLEPCETADILVFPTHADDDVFFFGPVIVYYAIEEQLTVQTAFMVNHKGQPERGHERLNGLWEMGVRHYPILGDAPDMGTGELSSGLNYYNRHSDIYSWQMEQIRRFRPLVILGHDPEGEYGNAGHKVNAYNLMQTVVDAADPQKHPESAEKYGVWDTPKTYLHLYEENSWMFDVNTAMGNDPEGRTPLQVANIALDCHVSQNGTGMSVYQDEYTPRWDCRPFGLYRTLVGYDSAADIMENIRPERWR